MATLSKKIDFIGFISVNRANPNGDPLNGNQPRTDYDGYGEISDVCLKRKIRNRWQDMGARILVQSNDRSDDGCTSIRDRVEVEPTLASLLEQKKDRGASWERQLADAACKVWLDVRAFGQLLAFKKGGKMVDAVSIGIRGPVSIHSAISLDPVTVTSTQITKSVNGESGEKRGSDTMGMKHRVDFGVYKLMGSVNVQLAERTGFSDEDAEKLKQALITLFENDASSARPEGSMEVERFYWIEHEHKTSSVPTAKVHRAVAAKKREGIEMPKSFADYVVDDSALATIPGAHVEKYIDGQLA